MITIIVFGLLILLYVLYIALTYIDKSIELGEAYGFIIGDSKDVTYKKAYSVFEKNKVYILYPIDKNGFGPHTAFTFLSEEFDKIKKNETWTFYFTEGYFDYLTLTFEDDKLIKIYRHRKKVELP